MSAPHILLTRASEDLPALAEAVAARGAVPLLLPCLKISPPADPTPLIEACATIEDYDALVLGSKNAAKAVAKALFARGRGAHIPVFVVGSKTADRLARDDEMQAAFQGQVFVPEVFRAESLFERITQELGPSLNGRRFLFPRAPEGRELLIDSLRSAGAQVAAPAAYSIEACAPATAEQRAMAGRADVVTFFSGQTIEAFLAVLGEAEARALLARAQVAVLGPVAEARALALGISVDLVAPQATLESLLDCVLPKS